IVLLQKYFSESLERKKQKIDYAGILLLSAAIITLLLGVPAGGKNAAVSVALTVALLFVFYIIEKKAEEPIVPFEILTRNNTIVNTISFLAAAVLIGSEVYMPIYIQNVLGFRATISGLSMAPMSVSWLLSSVILAKAIPKYGEQVVTGSSMFILLIGCLILPALGLQSPLIIVIICTFIMGFGFGGCFTTMTITIQASVDYSKRGAATALNALVRTIGHTIGVGIFGSIFNQDIVNYFNNLGIKGVDPNDLYSTANLTSLQNIQISINSALHVVFKMLIVITVVCLALSLLLPSGLRESEKPSLPERIT
ncbi:MAG: MFS transporter, partial [Syntrophaceticus sp.]